LAGQEQGVVSPDDMGKYLENFKKLLVFWKSYYATRSKDRHMLEHYARISPVEWETTFNLLLSSLAPSEPPLPISTQYSTLKK
jgi:hypothetical protein